ncbi:uncharacterized protein MONBRDRAFT_35021 [Monosiga brevicollis MX1]|uniref:Ubiquitin carboxyl-terminal hydrolase n=1 Tax=Monosiga brevicollis TaxID=81824 RepID=A9UV03_MONBE|nr:uncharacterized protein MONBRDRAFT_35021 [Monosiga brevicollis MX1]EDQ90804.1 predicted protein [Monosiga brevicollis MX1]|eukprot:XP_001744101.1 hypothetical protein [Monosiga brevicollis MX1]
MATVAGKPRWLPLESNPDVLNKFVKNMGLRGDYEFTDVFGLDPELLAMVPQPVGGVLLLFPVSDNYMERNAEEAREIEARGQTVSDQVYFMKQTISNACGTVGLLHCLGNNQARVQFEDGSYLQRYFAQCAGKSPAERGKLLEEANEISSAHEASAQEGQTDTPALEEDQTLHFICFVEKEGQLYELDGNKEFPINHGPTSPDTLLQDAAVVVRRFMEVTPDDMRFTVMAFSKTQ